MIPKLNEKNRMSGRELLRHVKDSSVAMMALDPQYRAVLDKMAYGNEGARQKGRAALPQMTDADIAHLVHEAERVLKPTGHLCLWIDKFTLVSARWQRWMPDPTPMRSVDCYIWDKERIGMGKRSRASFEAMLVIQKAPIQAKGFWPDRGVRDVIRSKPTPQRHAHAKPIQFMSVIIEQTTRRGDLVVDPCAGGYGVLEACQALGRKFMGCDLVS